jgi:glucose/arabinose dehydrogenase
MVLGAILSAGISCSSSHTIAISPTPPGIALVPAATGFAAPVHVTHAGDGSGRIFVVEREGRIRIVRNGAVEPTPFLDISARVSILGEGGLLSIAFPPGFSGKRYFYAYYTSTPETITVSRFHVFAGNPDLADPESEKVIIAIGHPTFQNHYGGQVAFGPDGFLYIGPGDGGGGGDPDGNGQNRAALLGKILRIDVESGALTYNIPATNPFVNDPSARPEVWAFGLRNPWRFSFDSATGDLFIGDVGQNLFEEINRQPGSSAGGENYGWNIMEGLHCFGSDACDQTGLTLPVAEYDHTLGCSVTGGHVYRGTSFPSMFGYYFYADFCSGRIWGLNTVTGQSTVLLDTDFNIVTFGTDEAGNLYAADITGGVVYEVTAVPAL